MPSNTRLSITFLLALSLVLAYSTNSKKAAAIAAVDSVFNPPLSIPMWLMDRFAQLTAPGLAIGGSYLFFKATRRAVFLAEMARILL